MSFIPLQNSEIDGIYRIGENVNESTNVYIVYHKEDDQKYILKLYKLLEIIEDEPNLIQYRNEMNILNELKDQKNKYIINLKESGTTYIKKKKIQENIKENILLQNMPQKVIYGNIYIIKKVFLKI